jgi:hypothetical protein
VHVVTSSIDFGWPGQIIPWAEKQCLSHHHRGPCTSRRLVYHLAVVARLDSSFTVHVVAEMSPTTKDTQMTPERCDSYRG